MEGRGGLEFLSRIQLDKRALTSHISIVAAIIQCNPNTKTSDSSFNISRRKVMELSHIKGIATYHKCINNLIEWGYIKYEPSYDPRRHSSICLLDISNFDTFLVNAKIDIRYK